MTGIRWAHERELTTTLGGEAEGGGRLADAYGTEASLQLDESLFHRSDHGHGIGRNNLLGTESHLHSSDLAMFDGFGDDPQEEDEDKEDEKEKEDEKSSDEKAKEKSAKGGSSSSPVDGVSAAMAATTLKAGAKEGLE